MLLAFDLLLNSAVGILRNVMSTVEVAGDEISLVIVVNM
jgi:hypothetical protein